MKLVIVFFFEKLHTETVLIYCFVYASCGREFFFSNYMDLPSIATKLQEFSVSMTGFDLVISLFFVILKKKYRDGFLLVLIHSNT